MSLHSIKEATAGPLDGTIAALQRLTCEIFAQTNLVRDVLVLVARFGYHHVECVVGHGFGCIHAALAGLMRPDVFREVIVLR